MRQQKQIHRQKAVDSKFKRDYEAGPNALR